MKGQSSQAIGLLLLALLVAGGLLFVQPLREKVAEAQIHLDSKAADLQLLQSEFDELQALADEVSKSEAKKKSLLDAVPVGHREDELILELTGLTAELGYEVNAINFALSNESDLGSTIVVTANFQGDYADLITFLQKLENADRLFQIKSISVQLTTTTEVIFSLNIQAFYQ